MITDKLIIYSRNTLFDKICENFKLDSILELKDKDFYEFHYELYENYIIEKIKLFDEQSKFILIEKEYTEHVWKEIYSLHYAHTTYSKSNKVMRVHFFNNFISPKLCIEQGILEDSYLGYVTLRPIPDFNLMLSFIVPNWNNLKYSTPSYFMTCEKNVHIFAYSIPIKTFEFYSQDSVVTTCADADIIMSATYTNCKYNHKMIKVNDIQKYANNSPLPSKGLLVKDMIEIFRSNGSPVDYLLKKKIKKLGETKNQKKKETVKYSESLKDSTNILDTYIESGLPVIIYNSKHVVLVIGHTSTTPKKYIVYDDSGVFLKQVTGSSSFVGTVSNKDLFPNNNNTVSLICATHGRVYMNAEEYDLFVEEYMKNILTNESILSKRSMIVDNVILKNHLLYLLESESQLDENTKNSIYDLIYSDLPHYLWYTEIGIYDEKSMFVMIGDTTYPTYTNLKIFKLCFLLPNTCKLELLTKIN